MESLQSKVLVDCNTINKLNTRVRALEAENHHLRTMLHSLSCDFTLVLQDEMLLYVFKFLDFRSIGFVTQVCKRWKDLASTRALLQRHKETIRIAKYASSQVKPETRKCSHGALSIACAPSGRIYVGCSDRTIKVWDCDGTWLQPLEGHVGWVTSLLICKNTLYSGSIENIFFWCLKTGNKLGELIGHEWSVNALTSPTAFTTTRAASLSTLLSPSPTPSLSPSSSSTSSPSWFSWIASGSDDSTVKIWDIGTHECTTTLRFSDGVIGLAVTSDGARLHVTTKGMTSIDTWCCKTWTKLFSMDGHWKPSKQLVCDRHHCLFSIGRDCTLRKWSTTGERLPSLPAVSCRATSIAIVEDPDGENTRLYIATWKNSILIVWLDKQIIQTIKTDMMVTALAVDINGERVWSCTAEKLQLW